MCASKPSLSCETSELIHLEPDGAGAIAGGQGERAVTEKEHSLGVAHGQYFGKVVTQFVKGAA